MAYLTNTRGTVRTDIIARLTGAFAVASERMAQYRVYRRTFAELDGLTDRELADLGLHRGILPSVARQAAYGSA